MLVSNGRKYKVICNICIGNTGIFLTRVHPLLTFCHIVAVKGRSAANYCIFAPTLT